MNCKRCGTKLKAGDRFCVKCGFPVTNEQKKYDIKDMQKMTDIVQGDSMSTDENQGTLSKNHSSKNREKTKKVIIIVLCLILIAIVAIIAIYMFQSRNTLKKYSEQMSLGNKYLAELNYEDAIIAYNEAIRIEPKQEKAYIALAQVYDMIDQRQNAEEILAQGYEATGSVAIKDAMEKQAEPLDVSLETHAQEKTLEEAETTDVKAMEVLAGEQYYANGFLKVGEYIFVITDGQLKSYHSGAERILVGKNVNQAKLQNDAYAQSKGLCYENEWIYYGSGNDIRRVKFDGSHDEAVCTAVENFEMLGVCEPYVYYCQEVESMGYPEYNGYIYNMADNSVSKLSDSALGGSFDIVVDKIYTLSSSVAQYANRPIRIFNLDGSYAGDFPVQVTDYRIIKNYIYFLDKIGSDTGRIMSCDINGENTKLIYEGVFDKVIFFTENSALLSNVDQNLMVTTYSMIDYSDNEPFICGSTDMNTSYFTAFDTTQGIGRSFSGSSVVRLYTLYYEPDTFGIYYNEDVFVYGIANEDENGNMRNRSDFSVNVIYVKQNKEKDREAAWKKDCAEIIVANVKRLKEKYLINDEDIYVTLGKISAQYDSKPDIVIYIPSADDIGYFEIYSYMDADILSNKNSYRLASIGNGEFCSSDSLNDYAVINNKSNKFQEYDVVSFYSTIYIRTKYLADFRGMSNAYFIGNEEVTKEKFEDAISIIRTNYHSLNYKPWSEVSATLTADNLEDLLLLNE